MSGGRNQSATGTATIGTDHRATHQYPRHAVGGPFVANGGQRCILLLCGRTRCSFVGAPDRRTAPPGVPADVDGPQATTAGHPITPSGAGYNLDDL
ncbi:hypothetical protein GCM10022206_55540 [Streptomyces chiangmaiensis]